MAITYLDLFNFLEVDIYEILKAWYKDYLEKIREYERDCWDKRVIKPLLEIQIRDKQKIETLSIDEYPDKPRTLSLDDYRFTDKGYKKLDFGDYRDLIRKNLFISSDRNSLGQIYGIKKKVSDRIKAHMEGGTDEEIGGVMNLQDLAHVGRARNHISHKINGEDRLHKVPEGELFVFISGVKEFLQYFPYKEGECELHKRIYNATCKLHDEFWLSIPSTTRGPDWDVEKLVTKPTSLSASVPVLESDNTPATSNQTSPSSPEPAPELNPTPSISNQKILCSSEPVIEPESTKTSSISIAYVKPLTINNGTITDIELASILEDRQQASLLSFLQNLIDDYLHRIRDSDSDCWRERVISKCNIKMSDSDRSLALESKYEIRENIWDLRALLNIIKGNLFSKDDEFCISKVYNISDSELIDIEDKLRKNTQLNIFFVANTYLWSKKINYDKPVPYSEEKIPKVLSALELISAFVSNPIWKLTPELEENSDKINSRINILLIRTESENPPSELNDIKTENDSPGVMNKREEVDEIDGITSPNTGEINLDSRVVENPQQSEKDSLIEAVDLCALGDCYYKGEGGVQKDLEKAVWYYEKAAEKGYAEAQYQIGFSYWSGDGVEEDHKMAVEWWKKAAEQGHAKAQYKIGYCYALGEEVEEDHKMAVEWWRKAAEQGYAKAQYKIGFSYWFGAGVEKDTKIAAEWWKKAAEQGHAEAQYMIGYCYWSGEGLEKNYKIAAEWWKKAAEKGHAGAQYKIGYCYALGDGVEEDHKMAAEWWKKAAEQGHAEAQYAIGGCYCHELGVEKDTKIAAEWWMKAAEQGHAEAQYQIGQIYYCSILFDSAAREKAVEWWKKAAEQGHAEAQYQIGKCYYNGEGVEKNYKIAVEWWKKAAEQGHAETQYKIGYCYYLGDGVEKNTKIAAEWWKKAAEQGHAEAQYKIGYCYALGNGVEKNTKIAAEWWKKAAEQGHVRAQYEIGECYSIGKGVEKNTKIAAEWWKKAAEQGHVRAQYEIGECYSIGKGVEKDTKIAAEWWKKAAEQGDKKSLNKLHELKNPFSRIKNVISKK